MIHPKLPKATIERFKKGLKKEVKGKQHNFTLKVTDYENFPLFQFS